MIDEAHQPAGGREIRAATRVLAVLGDPVDHSRSPRLQNAAMAAAGVDGVYVALRTGPDTLQGLLQGLARAGGGGNVTVPHKERAVNGVDRLTPEAERTGAVNTFWLEGGAVHGDNTDVDGFLRGLKHLDPRLPEGAEVLLAGAGGGARAALVALLDQGARFVRILNRSVGRARAMAEALGGHRTHTVESPEELNGASFDLVVNATSLGLNPTDPLPVPLDRLGPVGAVTDLVYGDPPLVRRAREHGIPAMDGREMLLQQGAAAFERWWARPAPMDAMRRALEGRDRL